MATAQFKIISPRAGFTGEGAAGIYFRHGAAEITVDLDSWEPASNKGALSYFRSQGFVIEPLEGVSVDSALRDPEAEANALLAEKESLQRQLDAASVRQDVEKLRAQVARVRAEQAERDAADRSAPNDPPAAGEGSDESSVRSDVPPPPTDAPVADWRAYAVEVDPAVDEAAAKAIGKPELQLRYGSVYRESGAQKGSVKS